MSVLLSARHYLIVGKRTQCKMELFALRRTQSGIIFPVLLASADAIVDARLKAIVTAIDNS